MRGGRRRGSAIAALFVAAGLLVALPTPAVAVGTLSVAPGRAIAGETVTFTGDMVPANRPVVLQRQRGNGWENVTRRQPGNRVGDFTFRIPAPARSTTYRVFAPRATIRGKTYAAAHTRSRTVTVLAQSATLTLPTSVTVGAPNVRARAEFRPARDGRPVRFQVRVGAAWKAAGSATQSRTGVASLIVDTSTAGTFSYRAVALAWGGAPSQISPTRTMTVTTGPDVTAPPVPTGVQTSGGDQVIHVSWSAVAAGDLAGYRVWQADSPTGSWTPLTAEPVAGTSRDVTAPNGVVKYFSVSAVDLTGNESERSDSEPGMAVAPDTTPPPVPTGLTGHAGNQQVALTWTPVAASDLDGYHVYGGTSSTGPWPRLTSTPVTSASYTATGLMNGTQYRFVVASVDDLGNESPQSAPPVSATPTDADTTPPPVPTGVSVEAGDEQVTVSWSAVTAGDLKGYLVFQGPSSTGPWTALTSEPVSQTSYVATGLTNGTTYWFVVRSVDLSGNPSNPSTTVSGTPADQGEWRQLSAGGTHSCGVKNEGSLWCWGNHGSGQLGVGGDLDEDYRLPVQVGSATSWVSVAAGELSTCAIRDIGSLWCWGLNANGQLGIDSTENHDTPVEVSAGTTWRSVDVGVDHACGVRTEGSLWCWGANANGKLGDNSTTERHAPVRIGGANTWTSVSTGRHHTCGVLAATLWCWGLNGLGQLGDGTTADRLAPAQVVGSPAFGIAVDAGDQFTCGLKADASLWCWGIPYSFQLGGPGGGGVTKVHVADPSSWRSVTTGTEHACGIRTDGSAWCWGRNDEGRTAAPPPLATELPTQVSSGSSWRSLSAGGEHTCGIRSDGSAWCWGDNGSGQLGNGTSSESDHVPGPVDP